MANDPEYAAGASTLVEVIDLLEEQGFTGQFRPVDNGGLECLSCREVVCADDVAADELRRTEGASDPADMAAVAGVTCPHCGTKGTVALHYGPEATPEEVGVLQAFDR